MRPLKQVWEQYISQIIISNGFSNKEVIVNAGFSKNYFYQVLNGRKKQPGRDKILSTLFRIKVRSSRKLTLY